MATGTLATAGLLTDDATSQAAGALPLSQGAVLGVGKTLQADVVTAVGGGSVSFPDGISGVTDGSSAAAGVVGEYVEVSRAAASPLSLANATVTDVFASTLTLGAGDWDLTIAVNISTVAPSQSQVGFSTVSATFQGTITDKYTALLQGAGDSVLLFQQRVSLSSPASFYCPAYQTSGLATPCWGRMSARRVR